MKLIKLIASSCVLLLWMQCAKTETVVNMEYHHTYCSNKWEAGSSTVSLLTAVNDFFVETHQISLEDINVTFDPNLAEACNACSCLDGQIIAVTVDQQHVDILEEEGFFIP